MRVIEGKLDAKGLRFALVVSRFNEALTSRLESGAVGDDREISDLRQFEPVFIRPPGLESHGGYQPSITLHPFPCLSGYGQRGRLRMRVFDEEEHGIRMGVEHLRK